MPRASNFPFHVAARALVVGCAVGLAGGFTGTAQAQKSDGVIYTCTDATGRVITSDRLIDSCLDRPQRVLSSQGWLIRTITPESSTAAQRAAQQEQERKAQLAQQQQRNQEQVDQALLIRYPTRDAHEASRRAALAQTQALLRDAQQRLAALQNERASLTRQTASAQTGLNLASNNQAIEVQQSLITGYQNEIARVNAQFDAEDKRLTPLWHAQDQAPANAASAATRTP